MINLDNSKVGTPSCVQEEKNIDSLSGIALFRYVLERIIIDNDTVDDLSERFDGNSRFVLGMIDFLKDFDWIEPTDNQLWKITEKGERFLNQYENNVSDA